jgi:hypothetical protein
VAEIVAVPLLPFAAVITDQHQSLDRGFPLRQFALDFRQLDDVLRGVAERHQQLAPPRQFDRIVKPVIPYAMNWTPLPLQWRLGPI